MPGQYVAFVPADRKASVGGVIVQRFGNDIIVRDAAGRHHSVLATELSIIQPHSIADNETGRALRAASLAIRQGITLK